ncbi:MAG: glutathione S-transferase family protein [Pseudomonadota bacterium]
MSEITLHRFPYSNFCEKVNWAFAYKGIGPKVVTHLPFLHMRPITKLSGQTAVPVIETPDQGVIAGSAQIIEYLESVTATGLLYPIDAEEKREVLRWQSELDEVGASVRGAMFFDYLNDKSFFHQMLTDGGQGGFGYKLMFRAMAPMLGSILRKEEPDPGVYQSKVREALDKVASAVAQDGYLVGGRFTAADLTAASLFYPVCYPAGTPGHAISHSTDAGRQWLARWKGNRALPYIQDMYARHRGIGEQPLGVDARSEPLGQA